MQELERNLIKILAAEHKDWIKNITDCEHTGEGLDIGAMFTRFEARVDTIQELFKGFQPVQPVKKKGFFGGKE